MKILKCKDCEGIEISVRQVDDREMYECRNCHKIWYGERESHSGPSTIIDKITDGVERNGEYTIDASILLNIVFANSQESFDDDVREWANRNKLKYTKTITTGGTQITFQRIQEKE